MQIKLIAYVVAALFLTGLLWKVNSWRNDAAELPVVKAEYASYAKSVEVRDAKFEELRKADVANRLELQTTIDAANAKITALTAKPIKQVTHHAIASNGSTCVVDTVSSDWIKLWNDTVQATIASPVSDSGGGAGGLSTGLPDLP